MSTLVMTNSPSFAITVLTFEENASVTSVDFKATLQPYDIVILDGSIRFASLQELISSFKVSSNPLIIVIGKNNSAIKIATLDAGADLYYSGQLDIEVYRAESRAAQRRITRENPNICYYAYGISIDVSLMKCLVDGNQINLSNREWTILSILLHNIGKVVSYDELMTISGYPTNGQSYQSVLNYVFYRIRKKIDKDNKDRLIKNVSARGYKIEKGEE